MAVAILCLLEFVFQHLELEGIAINRLTGLGRFDFYKAPGLAGLLVRSAQLVQERVAFPGSLTSAAQRPQGAQEPSQLAPTNGPLLLASALAFGQHIDLRAMTKQFDFDGVAQLLPRQFFKFISELIPLGSRRADQIAHRWLALAHLLERLFSRNAPIHHPDAPGLAILVL